MVRESFETLCNHTPAGDERCDAFDRYTPNVLIQENRVVLIFYHDELENVPEGIVPAFYCSYYEETPDCTTGRHRYD